MRIIPANSYVRAAGLGAVLSICLNSLFFLAQWWAVSPHGSADVLWYTLRLLLPMLGAMLAVPTALLAALLAAVVETDRKPALLVAVFAFVYAVIATVALRWSTEIRMHGFEKLAERSAPLVEAIKRYEAEQGEPPTELADLVPEYLPEIPSTGMGAYPAYEYYVGQEAEHPYRGNPRVLRVDAPLPGVNWDMFVYFPKGNYPREAYGAVVEKVGDWAYYHE